jgi:hypothetical protein
LNQQRNDRYFVLGGQFELDPDRVIGQLQSTPSIAGGG